ncbi:MAG: hypothetical protein KG003_07995 [Bacteroidetes bacterium]|nr:hypothetical protein [Bacteroidota bacterium]
MSEFVHDMGTDFQVFLDSLDNKPKYTEQELLEKMGYEAYQFTQASNFLIKYSSSIQKRRVKIRTILLAKRPDLIQNPKLKAHLEKCFEDIKFKPTKEDIDSFIELELGDIHSQMQKASERMKASEKLHDMYQKQLSWYQSVLKRETAEWMASNRGT